MTDITWSPDQQRALDHIAAHLHHGNPATPFVLKGAAGTGKTTLLKAALASRPCLALAPTHKACAVLTRTLRDTSATVKTIHAALGYAPARDDETGERTFERRDPDTLAGRRLVIVDEGSMVDATLWAELRADFVRHRIRAVVLGDPYQLPPVGEMEGQALTGAGLELHEVKRNAGVLCAAIADVRAQMGKGQVPWVWESRRDASGQVVGHREQKAMQAMWLDLVRAGEDVVCVAWTNKAVEIANTVARRAVAGENAAPFVPGEWLVMLEPHETGAGFGAGQWLHTEDRVRVLSAQPTTLKGFACWRVRLATPDGECDVCMPDAAQARVILAAHHDALRTARAAHPRQRGPLFAHAFEIKEVFAWARPHYATTIHKSQGSTWDHVFVMRDVWACQDAPLRDRLVYTAVSRPAKSLHLGVWA